MILLMEKMIAHNLSDKNKYKQHIYEVIVFDVADDKWKIKI